MKLTIDQQLEKCLDAIKNLIADESIHRAILMWTLTTALSTGIEREIKIMKAFIKEGPEYKEFGEKNLKRLVKSQKSTNGIDNFYEEYYMRLIAEEEQQND